MNYTNKSTNKQTNKSTNKQTNKSTNKQTNKQTSKRINKQTNNKQTNNKQTTNKQKQTNKQTNEHVFTGMKFYQNLYKKTLKLFETIKSVFPTPPLKQPIESSDTSTLAPPDTSYKPITPFMSPPGDTSRPPVPSRRLKPPNETEGIVSEDDTELALINWAADKQENNEVNINFTVELR